MGGSRWCSTRLPGLTGAPQERQRGGRAWRRQPRCADRQCAARSPGEQRCGPRGRQAARRCERGRWPACSRFHKQQQMIDREGAQPLSLNRNLPAHPACCAVAKEASLFPLSFPPYGLTSLLSELRQLSTPPSPSLLHAPPLSAPPPCSPIHRRSSLKCISVATFSRERRPCGSRTKHRRPPPLPSPPAACSGVSAGDS